MPKPTFQAGDLVSFSGRGASYTVTFVRLLENGNFIGKNPVYTKGGELSKSRRYVTALFTLVKRGVARDWRGRFVSEAGKVSATFTEKDIEIGAKYVNSRHPNGSYFGTSLAGELCMLRGKYGEFKRCYSSEENPAFWDAFSKVE